MFKPNLTSKFCEYILMQYVATVIVILTYSLQANNLRGSRLDVEASCADSLHDHDVSSRKM